MQSSKKVNAKVSATYSAPTKRHSVRVENHPARPAYSVSSHSHDFDSLCLVVAGKGYCLVEGCQFELEPMMSLFLPAGTAHSLIDKSRSAMTVFVINFDREFAEQQEEVLYVLRSQVGPQLLPAHVWKSLSLTLRQMLHEQNVKPPNYEVALHSLLASVLLHLSRAALAADDQNEAVGGSSEQRVRSVLDHVANTYYQYHSLPETAKNASLSQRRFSTLCRQISGQSFVTCLNAIRTHRARQLLETTHLPVAAVAFQVGFEELSTFYRTFRKHFGCSPRQINETSSCKILIKQQDIFNRVFSSALSDNNSGSSSS
ncbi:helix-turn-helix domain-containing protein [Planctomycetota bacterium]